MPKMKTHSGAKKRFKLTGKGKIKAHRAFTSHLMRKKSKKAKKRLRGGTILEPGNERRVKTLLGMK